jgi:hypothetical protein
MVRSQIGSLTFGFSFSHNLCFKYSNGTCEPILNIYVLVAFQWYKERFNPMSCDTYNCFLKIHPTWEPTWGCVGSFPHTLLHSWEHEMWLTGFILGPHICKPLLCHMPKVRVATTIIHKDNMFWTSCESMGWHVINLCQFH